MQGIKISLTCKYIQFMKMHLYLKKMQNQFLEMHFEFLEIDFDFLEMHFKKLKIHLQNYENAFFVQIKWAMVLKFSFINTINTLLCE